MQSMKDREGAGSGLDSAVDPWLAGKASCWRKGRAVFYPELPWGTFDSHPILVTTSMGPSCMQEGACHVPDLGPPRCRRTAILEDSHRGRQNLSRRVGTCVLRGLTRLTRHPKRGFRVADTCVRQLALRHRRKRGHFSAASTWRAWSRGMYLHAPLSCGGAMG